MPTLTALERRLNRATARLARLCDRRRPLPVLSPVELAEAAGIAPDPWQHDLLLSTAPRILTLCSRQAGKSTIAAVLGVHEALYQPGALVLLLSPSLRQSSELFKKCAAVYQAAGKPVPPAAESALQLQLENGSRLVSLPGKSETIRGYSGVRLLIIDEGAFVPDTLYLAVRPMLAVSGGRLLALSTPWGTRGWFYDAYERGGDGWERYRITAYECPRISPEFLDDERRAMGDEFFAAEYLCTFLDGQRQVFRREDIEAALVAGEGMETWEL